MVKEGGFLGRPQKEELWGGKRGGGGGGDEKKKTKKGHPLRASCVCGGGWPIKIFAARCVCTLYKKKKRASETHPPRARLCVYKK